MLGLSALAIGATWLVAASFEAALSPLIGRFSDRRGRLAPLRVGLIGSAAATAVLPWIDTGWALAAAIVLAACAFGSFWTPSMSMLADRAEAIGLDYAYGFALINLAWAPGRRGGVRARRRGGTRHIRRRRLPDALRALRLHPRHARRRGCESPRAATR